MSELWLIISGIIALCVLLFFTFLALLYVSGLLQSVDVGAGAPPIIKATVAYKFAKGSYGNAGSLFNDVTRLAPKSKAIGIYYDNPNMVMKKKLLARYCIVILAAQQQHAHSRTAVHVSHRETVLHAQILS